MQNLCAIVVSYNGDDCIENTIRSLKRQVGRIVIIDNGSDYNTIKILKSLVDDEVVVIYLNENKGIAYALNKGLNYALENKYKWIITFDQDTVPYEGSIYKLMNHAKEYYANSDKNVSFGAQLALKNDSTMIERKVNRGCRRTTYLITSGNLTLVDAARNAGGWTNELFIDAVDYDFSLKLRMKGYRLIHCYDCVMEHSLGEKKEGQKVSTHNNIRKYYVVRNNKYILKKYFLRFPFYCIFNSVMCGLGIIKWFRHEKDNKGILKIIKRGITDSVILEKGEKLDA